MKTSKTHINTHVEGTAFNRFFQECVGSCHAYLTLREDWRQHLRVVQDAIGFKQVRFHGLFHDLVGVYQEDRNGNPIFNFQNVDKIFDGLLSNNVRPFVELGFMPSQLASGPHTVFQYAGNITPPKDYNKWNALVQALAIHCIERYGLDEILGWRWEVWNEPNLDCFWSGGQAEYFTLYAETACTIKGIDSRLMVGGPATSLNMWVQEMIDYCAVNNVPLDFISTHHYCCDASFEMGVPTGPLQYRGQKVMAQEVRQTVRKIRASEFPNAEVHYTEWNVSPCHEDRFGKDSEFTAVFLLQTLRDMDDLAHSYSFWTLTDIFEESGPGLTPFSGKYGLLNLHGIQKPAFHAYRFLSSLYDTVIPHSEESLWVSRSEDGHLRLLTWNFTDALEGRFDGKDYVMPQDCERNEILVLEVPAGKYSIQSERMDRKNGNAYRAWQSMGEPQYPTADQMEALKESSHTLKTEPEIRDCGDGILRIEHLMSESAIIFYDLRKLPI